MTKIAAFGTLLKRGICQVETAVIVGTITGSGNATFTLTMAGMIGSPIATSVAVLNGDLPSVTARKAKAEMDLNANITAKVELSISGDNLAVRALIGVANDATMNLAYTNGTCTGLTPDATSTDTTAGVAVVTVASVKSIGGPGLALDNEDVTTHDQSTSFEEVVPTILRSGEVSIELVYDPNDATHKASTAGFIDDVEAKILAFFQIIFPGPYTWGFQGYAVGFEPSSSVDGALTASATIKITGQPTLV